MNRLTREQMEFLKDLLCTDGLWQAHELWRNTDDKELYKDTYEELKELLKECENSRIKARARAKHTSFLLKLAEDQPNERLPYAILINELRICRDLLDEIADKRTIESDMKMRAYVHETTEDFDYNDTEEEEEKTEDGIQ